MKFSNAAEIGATIKARRSEKLLQQAREYSKTLRQHIHGENKEMLFSQIDGMEDKALKDLRVKYARSNKDLFARLGRPLDKVFTAKGGSVYYNLSEDQEKKARALAGNIRNGLSVKEWIATYWRPHFLDDPNGLLFIEVASNDSVKYLQSEGRSVVYPTYKSVDSIFDYQLDGQKLEYVIFNVSEDVKKAHNIDPNYTIYRVYDDAADYFVRYEDQFGTSYILQEYSYPNIFGFVPGMACGSIPHESKDGLFISFFDNVIALAEEYLLTGSIRKTHLFLHGFPKYWEYADNCSTCGGTGLKDGDKCPECKGTGRSPMVKVSDVKLLTPPTSKEDPVLAPNVAGYVSPDAKYNEISKADLWDLENAMVFTLYGVGSEMKSTGTSIDKTAQAKTATQVMSEIKPQADRLYTVSEAAERVDKFIRDCMVIGNRIVANYQGASVNYGRRYILESPDTLFENYSKAKLQKCPVSALDDLYGDYLEARYSEDPVRLTIQRKLMKIEPFFHQTAVEVKALMPAEEDLKAKLYFGDWLSTVNDAQLLSFTGAMLKEMLYAYSGNKVLTPAQTAIPPAV